MWSQISKTFERMAIRKQLNSMLGHEPDENEIYRMAYLGCLWGADNKKYEDMREGKNNVNFYRRTKEAGTEKETKEQAIDNT